MEEHSTTIVEKNDDQYFRGGYSIDIVLLTFKNNELRVLLQKKIDHLEGNQWGLPGKLMLPLEDADLELERMLIDIVGTTDFYKKQLGAFSDVSRHPLGRVVTLAYYGLVPYDRLPVKLRPNLRWSNVNTVNKAGTLCFDHNLILRKLFKRFRKGLLRHPRVFELLPEEFILLDIIHIYEQGFGQKLDVPNFRRQILKSELLIPADKYQNKKGKQGRPAKLYTFKKEDHKELFKERIGFNFK